MANDSDLLFPEEPDPQKAATDDALQPHPGDWASYSDKQKLTAPRGAVSFCLSLYDAQSPGCGWSASSVAAFCGSGSSGKRRSESFAIDAKLAQAVVDYKLVRVAGVAYALCSAAAMERERVARFSRHFARQTHRGVPLAKVADRLVPLQTASNTATRQRRARAAHRPARITIRIIAAAVRIGRRRSLHRL